MRDIFKKRATGDDFYLLDNYDSVSEFWFNKKNIFFCGIGILTIQKYLFPQYLLSHYHQLDRCEIVPPSKRI